MSANLETNSHPIFKMTPFLQAKYSDIEWEIAGTVKWDPLKDKAPKTSLCEKDRFLKAETSKYSNRFSKPKIR